jgi:coenzyme F420 hydrogenase subunit beta
MGVKEMGERSYRDLKHEVWDTGICARCGACIAVCPSDSLFFEQRSGAPSPAHPESSGYCKRENDGISCGSCYRVCPRTDAREATPKPLLGEYIELLSARAAFHVERKQSGGAVTAICANALDEGLIDAVVTVTEDSWTLRPSSAIITTSDVLVSKAGSRYTWWVPLLEALKEAIIIRKYQRIAVVGLPCTVQALHRIRESEFDLLQPYAHAIRLVIGLFCTESFDYTQLIEGKLRTEFDTEPWEIRRISVKGKLEVVRIDDEVFTVPIDALHDCVPEGCRFCTDFASVDADISAGAVGSPAGSTTLIVRTPVGRGFVDRAVIRGMLEIGGDITIEPLENLAHDKKKRGFAE